MEKLHLIIIIFLAGFIIGYIVKDLLTVERKSVIHIKKQKIKGDGNEMEAVVDVAMEEEKRPGLLTRIFKKRKL
jgi:uncharacterized membrane protein YciS (DUF1049 family)